jgi:hypothetical protein
MLQQKHGDAFALCNSFDAKMEPRSRSYTDLTKSFFYTLVIQIESFIRDCSEAEFSHCICLDCAKKLYPDMDIYGQ